tara:strand:- start:3552 stop:4859 length:1308 start_codon:yes stop_codon:yes gene_type:complete
MFDNLDTNGYILIFASTIIISYFFNSYSKKSGIPAVLLLIGLGVVVNLVAGGWNESFTELLKLLGTVGLILIVLEAALDLKLLKEKFGVILKSLAVSIVALVATSYTAAGFISLVMPDFSLTTALLLTIPLSILSSAIILPSIEDLKENKKEFLIYESTFSDIVGIIFFYGVLGYVGSEDTGNVLPETFKGLLLTVVFSVVISYILVYIFQHLKGHAKLFLLISVLLFLYAVGKINHYPVLLIILIFGLILNNYKLFFTGVFEGLVIPERVERILSDFRLVTVESAFVVRTFFFILFGWSIVFSDLLSFKVIGVGIVLIIIIYLIRALVLLVFGRTFSLEKITPEVFVAPRGLITILLFYKIPDSIKGDNPNLDGILLFVILFSCLIMSWSLIKQKKKDALAEEELITSNDENDPNNISLETNIEHSGEDILDEA